MAEEIEPTEQPEFIGFLIEHRNGDLAFELSNELAQLVNDVKTYGKAGTLTLTIGLEQRGRNIIVVDKVSSKNPQPDREVAIYYPTKDGGLVQNDPDQLEMFKEIAEARRENQRAIDFTEPRKGQDD